MRVPATKKVVILYRVLAHYRVPVFARLAAREGIDLTVLYGCDFPGTKVRSWRGGCEFDAREMPSIPISVKTSNGLAVAPFSPSLLIHLVRLRPDVIVCEGASNLPNNVLAYMYAWVLGVPIVQWGLGELRNSTKSLLRRSLDWLIETMERRAGACVAYSSIGASYYRRIGVDPDRIFVAVNVVDTDRIASLVARAKAATCLRERKVSDFVVLFVGALNPDKKVDDLIRAFARFQAVSALQAELLIVGDGDERARLEALAKSCAGCRIQFLGEVVDGVSKYFLMADVFVLPGLGGLAVSEALAYGVPVVCGIADGCEVDLLADGGGILDSNLNENSIFEHLVKLASDPDLLRSMRSAARRTIDEKFNIRNYVDNLEAAIDRSLCR